MKFDSRYSAPIRPIFRILAFIIGIPMVFMGIAFFIGGITSDPFEFDGDFKFGISATIFGFLIIIAIVKGHLPKWLDHEEREQTFKEGKFTTRKMCLLILVSFTFVISVLVIIFLSTKMFSIVWWLACIFSIPAAFSILNGFAKILYSKGFNTILSFTIIFPIMLLVIGVISPSKYDKIYIS